MCVLVSERGIYPRELLLVGGDSAKDQMRALQEGVDIVTGTPGRLDDFISTGKLDLSGVGGACFHSNVNTPPLSLSRSGFSC